MDRVIRAKSERLRSIGRILAFSRCYAVMGYGGNGITFSMLAAQLPTSEIAGRKDPDAELFRFPD